MGHSTRHRIRVRYAECDPLGVVFNANYFLYFDIALTELWRDAGVPYTAMMEEGVDTAVVEATARFHAPARFDDELELEAAVERLGTTIIVTTYRITRDETLICEGRTAHVCVDPRSHQKVPIPPVVRRALGGPAE